MSDGNRDADDAGLYCCGGLRDHAYDCHQRVSQKNETPAKSLSTLLAELDAALECAVFHAFDQATADAAVKVRNAWPALKAGIEQLQRERDSAEQSCVEIAGQRDALRTLLAQRTEALRVALNRAEQLFNSDRPPPKSCGRCGTPSASCDGDCADHVYIAQDLWKARAVLAAEVPRG